MNNSTAIHADAAPQPLLSAPLRIAIVVAVALLMLLVVTAAQHESQQAVRTAAGTLSRGKAQVTLPAAGLAGGRERGASPRGGAAG